MDGTSFQMIHVALAYAAALVLIAGLIAWIALDYRLQRRRLAALEKQGMRRSPHAAPMEPRTEEMAR